MRSRNVRISVALQITGSPMMVDSLTEEELEAVTVVFHQYETGLREGTILTRVHRYTRSLLCDCEIFANLSLKL